MELNVNWDQYKTQVSESSLDEELKAAMHRFLDEFATLPLLPNTFGPWQLGRCIWWLMDEVFAEELPASLSWEIYLDLAKKWAADRGEAGENALIAVEELAPLLTAYFNNDDTEVILIEITQETAFNILLLSDTLSEPKKYYVASNAQSLAQANFSEKAWYRAIYAGKSLVGFVMLYIDEEEAEYIVWRLMIGEPFHGRGYGRKAMDVIIKHVRSLPNATKLILSYGQGSGSPEGFYKKLGFVPTGEVESGEVYASISLK